MNRLRRAWFAAILTLCVASLVHPAIAWAHARLKRSAPAAKSTLDTPPRELRLWFTEQPELAFTKVTLADSAGVVISVGAVENDPEGPMAVRVPILGTLRNGRYTVSWKTAASDGHPSTGTFSFRVAAAAAPPPVPMPAAAESVHAPAHVGTPGETGESSPLTPAFIVVRAISFAMLLSMIGAVAFRFVVLPRAVGLDASASDGIAGRMASFATGASALFLLAALAKLYLEMRMLSGNAAMDAEHLRTMTMSTSWGSAWRAQLLAALGAFVGFLVAQRMAAGWWLAALSAMALAVASALGGHAASAEQLRTLSVAADAVHILGAAGWMGSLLWLVVAAVGPGRSASRAASLVHAFSPAALGFGAIIGVTGLVSAWLRLGQLSSLWASGYGQVLLVKLVLLAVLAAVGYHNWRRVMPTLGTDEATVRLERSAKLELGVGLLIIVVTAILVATPTPVMG